MINALSRSLTFRLVAIFVVLGALFVFGSLKGIQRFYNSDEVRGLISGHLSLHVNYVREDIGVPPRIDRAIAITESVPVDIRILGPDVDWASDPAFPRLDALVFAPSPLFSDAPDAWVDELPGVDFAELDGHSFLRMRQGSYDIVVATPRMADPPSGPPLLYLVLAYGLSLLILAYAAVYWLFSPIARIREGAEHIGKGHFGHRISDIRHDQLGDLAADINQMAGDVEHMLDAKRGLLLGISHELRTPLSRMKLTLEFCDDKETVDKLKEEILEMEKIVSALLEAEKLNTRHAKLARTRVDLGELVDAMLNDFFSRNRERIEVDLPNEPLVASVDAARITLLLKNLLSNALRYSKPEDGLIRLAVRASGSDIVLMVADQGPGISRDRAEHIGEPFYRSDPSRARTSGGTGLGLYLATLVATAHGGTLRLLDTTGKGACFEVRIPRKD